MQFLCIKNTVYAGVSAVRGFSAHWGPWNVPASGRRRVPGEGRPAVPPRATRLLWETFICSTVCL